ncbi:hypothetical protein LTR84_011477 [Exophiala bonariae]|uniref:Enoyl reductase (ER) domain-containing protein n=1 Tax=Exophiala bonariae TaxID=1690606 RepID=A0AAV9NGL5_9EURO|nr:hypothetical protein LTR84_011477 [Exophiala bonariae]
MGSADTQLPSDMLAVQAIAYSQPPKVNRVPVPSVGQLGGQDILLKTAVASLCHTDLMVLDGVFQSKLPITMSHEGTGIVVAVGNQVSDFKVGDRVMTGIKVHACGKCINCNPQNGEDWNQYCWESEGAVGLMACDGAFAEYHIADSKESSHVPDSIPFAIAAPLACAGVTVYRAVLTSQVKEGGLLAIVGAGGGLGHFGIQFARARGIKVIAIEARDEALEICRKLGAEHVLDVREGKAEVVKKVHALTEGQGVEAVVNVSDHPTSAALSAAITRTHGTVIQAAQPTEVCVPFQDIVLRDVTIKGTMLGGRGVAQEMLEVVARHNIKAETQVFHGLEEVPNMVELSRAGKLKGKAICIVDSNLR